MIEMTVVLITCMLLMGVAYELTFAQKREWGENSKSFF